MDNQQTNPFSFQESSGPINLSEKDVTDIGTETIKYSIRTMAQDLERAKKEGASLTAAGIKTPTIPPPPPPKIFPPKPVAPIAPTAPKPPAITPPTIKPISEAPLKVSPLPTATQGPVATPIPTPAIPAPTIKKEITTPTPASIVPPTITREPATAPIPAPMLKREIPPPAGLPITPKPSITTAIPPSAIPRSFPPTRPATVPSTKKSLLPSLPQLNLLAGIVAVAVILLGSIGLSYWWFFVRQVPEEQPITEQPTENIPVVITEPIIPEKISHTDADIIIEVSTKIPSSEMAASLKGQISSSVKQLGNRQLGRILIKHSTDTEKSYLSLAESLALLQITIPANINDNIQKGELLAYNQSSQYRYGFATTISNTLSIIDSMKTWEQTILLDLNNLFIDSSPVKPANSVFQDDYQNSFIIRYLNLPTSTLSIAWAESGTKQIFIVATSKDMAYKIIGVETDIEPVSKTYPSGTLVKAKSDNRIYRIIDDKKLWIPTIKAFLDSGYKPYSEIEISQEELNVFANVKYAKISTDQNVYELRDNKRYLLSDTASLPQQEIKIVTSAELNAYPLGK